MPEAAHAAGVPLIVDNTVATPYLLRPLDHGADVVVHSLTKYLGGHGTSVGGAIVDSGRFPWAEHAQRFARLNTPDPSYHGVVYTEALGPAAFIGRARVVPLRNTGAAISPLNAFLILQGIETLALRMDRINDNTAAVARHLQQHPAVSWVRYAGLPSHVDHAVAQRYLKGRPSGVLSFGIRGGRAAGERFLDRRGAEHARTVGHACGVTGLFAQTRLHCGVRGHTTAGRELFPRRSGGPAFQHRTPHNVGALAKGPGGAQAGHHDAPCGVHRPPSRNASRSETSDSSGNFAAAAATSGPKRSHTTCTVASSPGSRAGVNVMRTVPPGAGSASASSRGASCMTASLAAPVARRTPPAVCCLP